MAYPTPDESLPGHDEETYGPARPEVRIERLEHRLASLSVKHCDLCDGIGFEQGDIFQIVCSRCGGTGHLIEVGR